MVGEKTTMVALAALCWGLAGGIGGMLIDRGWGAFVVSFYRGAIGLVLVLIWLGLRPFGSGLKSPWLWFWSAVAGLGVAGNFSFYFVSIEQGSVAVAATLMYCAPVFVYLMSFALKFEKPTVQKWVAIAVVLLGIVLLTKVYDLGASTITPIGVAAGLLAGLSYAIFIFGFKYAAPHGSPQAVLSVAFAVLAVILIVPSNPAQTVAALQTPDWPLFLTIGMLGAGFSFVFYIIGLNYTVPAVASIVAMVEPVTASVFGVVFLREQLAVSQIVGMALILITVTALSIQSSSS